MERVSAKVYHSSSSSLFLSLKKKKNQLYINAPLSEPFGYSWQFESSLGQRGGSWLTGPQKVWLSSHHGRQTCSRASGPATTRTEVPGSRLRPQYSLCRLSFLLCGPAFSEEWGAWLPTAGGLQTPLLRSLEKSCPSSPRDRLRVPEMHVGSHCFRVLTLAVCRTCG